MKKEIFEDWQSDAKYNNEKRFVSLYRDDELRKLLSGLFVIIHDSKIHLGGSTYLNYLCLKNNLNLNISVFQVVARKQDLLRETLRISLLMMSGEALRVSIMRSTSMPPESSCAFTV